MHQRFLSLASALLVFLSGCSSNKSEQADLAYLLIDRTGQWRTLDQERFDKTLETFADSIKRANGALHVVVASINDSTLNFRQLVSMDKPGFGILDNPEAPSARRKVARFESELEKNLRNVRKAMRNKEQGVASPLLEALSMLTKQIRQRRFKHVTLYVFSDMVQNSGAVNFWKMRRVSPNDFLVVANQHDLIPDMTGFSVFVYGVGNFDYRDNKWMSAKARSRIKAENDAFVQHNEKLWRAYFKAAHASLREFAPFPL